MLNHPATFAAMKSANIHLTAVIVSSQKYTARTMSSIALTPEMMLSVELATVARSMWKEVSLKCSTKGLGSVLPLMSLPEILAFQEQ